MAPEDDGQLVDRLDLTPSPRLLEVLGDIPYKPWQCLAELIDNSFDDFLTHPADGETSRVDITLPRPTTGEDALVCVRDNGRGMSRAQLESALKAGYSTNSRFGSLGLFGMGFNIATARLGLITEVRSTQAGDPDWLITTIDFRDMQNTGSFTVPLRRERKDDLTEHGTEITVRRLRPELREALTRPNTTKAIFDELGRVYSYLLRSEQPAAELPVTAMAGRGFALYVNGRPIKPRLPCVWGADRFVRVGGDDVYAIQPIDIQLSAAVACMTCGYWQRIVLETCVECGSSALETRERRIHGWLGVQRYLDASSFGIDFLRNGRKILTSDKSLFTWENHDTGETLAEYPIEVPANQGRLVGEIHLDHVAVYYQKTDFDRQSADWRNAVVLLRGDGPMLPRKAREKNFPENDKPLARLHKAFRRNDPGLKCLTPGDGHNAIHDQARKWGDKFHQQIAEYATDAAWYAAAASHDALKEARTAGTTTNPAPGSEDVRRRTGLDDEPTPQPTTQGPVTVAPTGTPMPTNGAAGSTPDPAATPTVTAPITTGPSTPSRDEVFDGYRANSHQLFDLEGDVSVGELGRCQVTVWATTSKLTVDGRHVPVTSRARRGNAWEIFLDINHTAFRDYGRDPRDYAIMEIVNILQTRIDSRRATPINIAEVAAQVVRQFPELRVTEAALRERAGDLLGRIRELGRVVTGKQPAELWALLSPERKQAAEVAAAIGGARLDWQAATLDGSFVLYLDAGALAVLIGARPELFLDGTVFDTRYLSWTDEEARRRQVTRITSPLTNIGEFLHHGSSHSHAELAMARLSLDMLFDELSADV